LQRLPAMPQHQKEAKEKIRIEAAQARDFISRQQGNTLK